MVLFVCLLACLLLNCWGLNKASQEGNLKKHRAINTPMFGGYDLAAPGASHFIAGGVCTLSPERWSPMDVLDVLSSLY
jgi:hypothetical protein